MSKKISELPNATVLSGTETVPLVQAGETRKTTVAALQTVADGAITTPKLQDSAVTTPKLNNLAVTTAKIADSNVTLAKLQNITASRLLGRVSAGSGIIEELTGTQAQAVLPIGQTRVDVASAATVDLTAGAANTAHINITGTTTITAFTIAAGRTVFVRFAGILTLTNNAGIVTQTGANIVTQAGDTCILRATAANVVEVLSYSALSRINEAAAVTLTTQTAVDFTGIPSWARRVTVFFANLSTNGTSAVQVQIGAGSVETTGYVGVAFGGNAGGNAAALFSTGALIVPASAAAMVLHGRMVIERHTGNTWVFNGQCASSDGTAIRLSSGSKTIGGQLDRLRLTTVNGTDQFDAGTVSISWE